MVHEPGHRNHATRTASAEALRRAGLFGRVAAIVVLTILATLVFSGHRMAPDCLRALVCFERPQ